MPKPHRPSALVSVKVPPDVGDSLRRESLRRRGMSPRPAGWSIGEIVAELVRERFPAPKAGRRAPRKP